MSQFDLAALPAPLGDYFTAGDRRAIIGTFAPDARVRDEGEDHVGTVAIANWLDRVETRYQPRYAIKDAKTAGDQTVVTFVVSGTFPGSPATLRQQFVIAGDKITSLVTL
ncbi:MAG: nuclear transport factor 2 family protein [Devosia sp.]|jgi:hypothetical protein